MVLLYNSCLPFPRLLFICIQTALSLEPTGAAERHMKDGRGHVCNNNPVHGSRSNSYEYLALSLSEAVCCSTWINRLFGDNTLFNVSAPLFSFTDTFYLGRPCTRIRPSCRQKGTEICTTEETTGKEGKNLDLP